MASQEAHPLAGVSKLSLHVGNIDTSEPTYYIITFQTADDRTVTAEHRYSDFEALHELLTSRFASYVPPLPQKRGVMGRLASFFMGQPNYYTDRAKLLNDYLNELIQNPQIASDDLLQDFLLCPPRALTLFKKRNPWAMNFSKTSSSDLLLIGSFLIGFGMREQNLLASTILRKDAYSSVPVSHGMAISSVTF